ncbi:MAG TPA: hypothetical protein VMY37_11655 [Thermoguttaceae bacterium]|nr:hypothetical protein [Thermoguttaceae bacterium]
MHALTLSLALSLLAAAPPASDNPCTNGSFERLAPSGFPADWGPIGATVEVSSDAHSGERSLRFLRTADNKTVETGLNRGPLIDRLRGGMDFWYKAVSAKSTKLNVYVIPMNDEPREGTGSPRATFTVPESRVGDGRWHHGRLKYDFTDNPKVKSVHFAVRILGSQGELLLDDVSYVERVGPLLRLGKVRLEEDPERPGERCTVRAAVENAGDAPAPNVRATMIVPEALAVSPAEVPLGNLAPDEKTSAVWTLEGSREKACRLQFAAASGEVQAETSYAVAPELVLRSFGPTAPVAMQKIPVTLECVLENRGSASVVNPTAVFQLPTGPVSSAAERLHPGQTLSLTTRQVFDRQSPALPIAVRVGAENVDRELTAETTLVVGAATRLVAPPSEIKAAATDDFAVLENEHVRLLFRRNEFGFGPAELFVSGRRGPPVTVAWLPRLGRVVLQGADGSRREHVVLTDGPPKAQTGDRASLEFAWTTPEGEEPGCRVRVRFGLGEDEKTISADYELTCSKPCKLLAFDGPMLYALDRDEAVLPGLEWLVDDEVSSGTLDIAEGHPHQLRYVVHPNMVTIPAVGIHGKHGTVGLVWDVHQKWDGRRDRPSLVFASPDRFENQRTHLMGLFLPGVPEFVEPNQREATTPYPLEPGKPLRLSARIFADGAATDALAAVDQWARLYGCPEPEPLPHGSYDREIEFSMQAYLQSLWEEETKDWWTTKGGGMMSQQGRPQSFVADLLLGEILSPSEEVRRACRARAQEVLAMIGGEARIDVQRFSGRADLAMANPGRAAGILASRGEDGAWRFDADQQHTTGPFVGKDYHELGPDDAVELGTCARRAFEVLNYARIAGDREAYDAMEKTLVLMESFRVPRAAQVWEVPVHTPDVLAAADAVDAYVEAYRFSGDERWLRDAVTWARRGLPFIYLWDDPEKPFLVGGSIPVFGATWYQGSWFGRPVQWNGLRYANSLLKLCDYDDSYPWRKIAEAIIRSAIHQQDLDGENVALWPDNVSAIDCEKCPWVFAPRQIIRNVLKLTGRDEDPATVILGEGERRLHVTAAAKISEPAWDGGRLAFGVAYPQGEQGVVLVANVARPKSVLVDGKPIPEREDVESGPEPGWRHDVGSAYLAIRIAREGESRVEVQGAEHLAVRRLPWLAERIAFEFDESSEGWTGAHHVASMNVEEGVLRGRITGGDPYLVRMLVRVEGDECPVVRLRMRVSAGQGGQLFWTTAASPGFAEDKAVPFAIQADGQFHEYRLEPGRDPMWAGQTITALRIDPGNGAASGEFAIDYVRGEKR